MNNEQLYPVLIEWVNRRTGMPRDAITEDTALFSSGLLDSFDLLDLIVMLEGAIGRKISAVDVNLENFDSPTNILSFLGR